MTTPALRFAMAAVRAWTRIYTWRLPTAVREARREEIEYDLWEGVHDPERRSSDAVSVLARLLFGIHDDVRWRLEEGDVMEKLLPVRAIAAVAVAGAAVWFVLASRSVQLPPMPAAPVLEARTALPSPAPPPPPPLAPGQARHADIEPLYGETSYTASADILPRKIKDVPPVYPPIAVMYGLQGTVLLEATVDEAGRVAEARILKSARIFEQPSIDAVKQWQFEPARSQGRPVPVVIGVTVKYTPPSAAAPR